MARPPNNHHVLPLFCDDLIASCVDMTPAQFGAYMRLLCYAWTRGGIPNDERACSRIAGGFEPGDWDAIRARLCVINHGTDSERLSHQRLELERVAVAELKAKKSHAGKMGGRPKAEEKQNESKTKAEWAGIAKQNESKTKAPTPTPTHVIHTHTQGDGEPWAGKSLDQWSEFREKWNKTSGAEPWVPLTPPSGSLWVERSAEPSWIEQYPLALSKLGSLKRFTNPVTLTQFLADGWVGRIVAGDFDKPQQVRGRENDKPPPVDSAKRRFFRSDSQQNMTDAEYAAWRRDKRQGGIAAALAESFTLKDEDK